MDTDEEEKEVWTRMRGGHRDAAGVLVRVIFHGSFAICLLDLGVGCILVNSKNFIQSCSVRIRWSALRHSAAAAEGIVATAEIKKHACLKKTNCLLPTMRASS